MIGIYRIVHKNKVYIGQSVRLETRWRRHLGSLSKGKHANARLQNIYNKYGPESLTFEILVTCESSELDALEISWINSIISDPQVESLNLHGGGRHHEVIAEETRLKLSLATSGENNPMYGVHRVLTQEHKDKIFAYNQGKHTGPMNSQWGKKASAETRAKMSLTRKGRKTKPCAESTKQKISEALRRRAQDAQGCTQLPEEV
jgi:group I intron endonuclease